MDQISMEPPPVPPSITTFPCQLCRRVFLSNRKRLQHLEREHGCDELTRRDGEVVYDCHGCQGTFSTPGDLAEHCRVAHPDDEKQFHCQYCTGVFLNKTYLNFHMESYHPDKVENIQCQLCQRTYNTIEELESHRKNCPKNLFACRHCTSKFPNKRAMHDHMRSQHRKPGDRPPPKKKFTCLFCGKMFVRRQDMETHQRTHTGDKPFKCTICGKGFVSNSEMHHHMPSHGTAKSYRCQFCGIAYKNISTLTHHRRVKHLNPISIPCMFPECSYVGQSEKLLKSHIKTAHIEHRSHSCECGKTFSSRSHLYDHQRRVHNPNNERRFVCPAEGCSRRFQKQATAEKHYRLAHDRSKGFKCCKCLKVFPDEPSLKQHYESHGGSRFFYCPKCFTVIANAHSIREHMIAHYHAEQETKKQGDNEFDVDQSTATQEDIINPTTASAATDENVEYEIVVDQLQPDPKFDRISLQIETMLMYEKGKVEAKHSACDLDIAESQVTQFLAE